MFVGTVNLLPFVAVVLLNTRSSPLAGWLLLVPFGLALTAGVITHFFSPGPDNVFRIPAGPWTWSFRISAVLLIVLEAIGCWLAVVVLRAERCN
jgi:hypothetical protein